MPEYLLVSQRSRVWPAGFRPWAVLAVPSPGSDLAPNYQSVDAANLPLFTQHWRKFLEFATRVGYPEAMTYLVEGPLSGQTFLYTILPASSAPLPDLFDWYVMRARRGPFPVGSGAAQAV